MGTKWGHESKVPTCEEEQGNRMDVDGIEPLNVQPKCRRINRWSKHSDARTALEGTRNSNQRPSQEVPERREPNCADVGQPAGTADPAAEGTPDRNLGNTLETFTSKAQEASTQTGSPEEDGRELTLSTDVVTTKKFVDVGSQTLTDVRGRSWSDDPDGCPDCSEDTGGESGDLAISLIFENSQGTLMERQMPNYVIVQSRITWQRNYWNIRNRSPLIQLRRCSTNGNLQKLWKGETSSKEDRTRNMATPSG